MCKCICPECVIHGPHKNHETKTIKRALPEIKEKIFEMTSFIEKTVQQIEEVSVEQNRHLEVLAEKVNGSKKAIKQSFDNLRRCIT
jgi:hypothetical protein